jgi:hypothetical protein
MPDQVHEVGGIFAIRNGGVLTVPCAREDSNPSWTVTYASRNLSALFVVASLGRAVSLQFSILKVLAGQPGGRATVADLNRYITLLSCPEWTARMKRLSALAPDLDIFGSRYVLRDVAGWQLTEAGHAFLAALEMPPWRRQLRRLRRPRSL